MQSMLHIMKTQKRNLSPRSRPQPLSLFLWRGAYGGTESIDSKYREIMESGINNFQPLARRPKGASSGPVSIEEYISSFLHILDENDIGTEEQWVTKAYKVDYKKYKDVSRFLLFCAADDAVLDPSNPGLIQRGRIGVCPLLSLKQWHQEELFTVEHIAPQSSKHWVSAIYDEGWVNTLGNLTLLPERENNVISNKPWTEKKLFYRLLSAQTEEDFEACREKLSEAGVRATETMHSILDNSKYLELCRSIAQSDKWDVEIIENRSKRLAALAWERLSSWLNPKLMA